MQGNRRRVFIHGVKIFRASFNRTGDDQRSSERQASRSKRLKNTTLEARPDWTIIIFYSVTAGRVIFNRQICRDVEPPGLYSRTVGGS
jgi:hypothetical protein